MCTPETLKRLVNKYKSGEQLSSAELRTMVEGLDSFVTEGANMGAGKEIAASYMLARIASRIEELQAQINEYGKEFRDNFAAISRILDSKTKPSIEEHPR